MKATKVLIENFGAYTHFEAELPEGSIDIIGLNGAGKSTFIKSFLACLKGIAKTQGGIVGERYQFIGPLKSTAKIAWTLHDAAMGVDVTIKNVISKSGNQISFEAPEGYILDEAWLKDLFNIALMSTKQFCSHTPKEQSSLLGIDTDVYDREIKRLKEAFTLVNHDLTGFGDLGPEPEKVDEVKIDELSLELQNLQDVDKLAFDDAIEDLENRQIGVTELLEKIDELEKELAENRSELTMAKGGLEKAEKDLKKTKDPTNEIAELQEKIRTSQETNDKFTTWENWKEKTEQKIDAQDLVDNNKKLQKEQGKLRVNYLKVFKFPFTDMGVDDSGGLTLSGRHINENGFSQGELELIIAKIVVVLNPQLRIRLIDDASLLDPKKDEYIRKRLEDEGFQLIMFYVGDEKTDKNSILLRECRQVDSGKGDGEKLID